jgi:hypothetical protein
MPFSVDQTEFAVRDLAAGLARPTEATAPERHGGPGAAHRGGRDGRQSGRGQSGRGQSGRGQSGRDHARAGGGKSRSYAFRRS